MRTMILVGATALAAAVALQASAQSGGQGTGQWQGGQGRGQGQGGQAGQTHGGKTQGGQAQGSAGGGQSGGGQQQQTQQKPAQQVQPVKAQPIPNGLTLYESTGYGGRQSTYNAASSDVSRQGYQAHSARSSGAAWTLCQSSDPRGPCRTITSGLSSVGFTVGMVRPGRQEITLYATPNFGGRQVTYYGATNTLRPPAFQARSAKSIGGDWTICEGQPGTSQCATVNGAVSNMNMLVAVVQPGKAPANPANGQGGRGNSGGYGQGGNGQGGSGQGRGGQGDGYGRLPQAGQRYQYTCGATMSLAATFAADGDSVKIHLQGRDDRMTLDRVQSSSRGGFSFADQGMQFSGSGTDATYSERGRPPLVCSSAH